MASTDRCGFCRDFLEKVPEGMSKPRIQGKLACQRCIDLHRAPMCRACGERVRDAKKNDPEPYHEHCRRCSSCHQIIAKSDIQKLAGKLLCGSCSNLFGHFFCPDRRPEVEHLKETFSAWDNDGSGFIEQKELGRVLKALDPNFSDGDIIKLIRNIDTNGDGLIDFSEFCDWVMQGDKAFELGEDSFENFVNGLMREAGVAVKQSSMRVLEVHIRPDGVWFALENGETRLESKAVYGAVDIAVLDPEEFIKSVECTEKEIVMVMNTGRTVKIAATGKPWGPWVAPDGFHIVGLRSKPGEGDERERITGIDCSPLHNAKTYDVPAALRFAAENEFLSMLRSLLPKLPGNLDGFSPGGVTALMLAAQNGNCGAMRMLLGSKASLDFTDSDGWTALTYASRCGQTAAVGILLDKGATQEGDGGSALGMALAQQHNSAARALLRAGFGSAPKGTFALEDTPDETACTLPRPEMSPEPSAFSGPVTVTLEAPRPKAGASGKVQVRYSLDGRDPFTAGQRYRSPITLTAAHNYLRVVAVQGRERSAIADGVYVVCHYAMPDEVVSGTLRVRIFPQAQCYLRDSLATVLGMNLERVMVNRQETDSTEGGSSWLTISLRDPAPRHRLHIDRPFTLVRQQKARSAFVDAFTRDLTKAVGAAPAGIEVSAGSIIVDFTLPRDEAEQLRRQLGDPTSFLLSKAKTRPHLKEASLSVVQSLGDRLSKPEVYTDFQHVLSKKSMSINMRDLVCFGSGDTGVVAVVARADQMKALRKNIEKTVKDVLPDVVQEGIVEGPENIELQYSVDVISSSGENGGTVARMINSGELPRLIQEDLQKKRLPATVSVGARATSRPLTQLEFRLKWDYPKVEGKTEVGPIQDFLDGICLVYSENKLAQIIDFKSAHEEVLVHDGGSSSEARDLAKAINRAVQHSGDVMSDTGGEHDMQIDLGALPPEVTDIYFVLAAYEADSLASFPNPSVCICDAYSKRELTRYHIHSAGDTQAVIMCSLTRPSGRWVVNGLGIPTAGSVRRYEEIRQTLGERQAGYLRWERRQHLVALRAMLKTGRVTEASTNEFAKFMWGVLGLPISVFQLIVRWL